MNKRSSKILFSSIGVIVVFLILLLINFIFSSLNSRLDLTEEKVYTLSDNTKKIIGRLDTPVTIKFYYTKSQNMPGFLKTYATRIVDLLSEYKRAGKGKLIIEKYDPVPDSEAEDSAQMDGVAGQPLNTGDKIYLGISIQLLDQVAALPFLSPEREQLLEYDITRAITQVCKSKKSVLGVMSGLPVLGEKPNPMMMQMGQFKTTPPWIAFKELKNDYDLVEIPLSAEVIDPNISMLIVFHPAGISDKAQFAIDQFILKGGKVLAFVDPCSFYNSAVAKKNNQMQQQQPQGISSNLDKLFKAWGLAYDPDKVVADMTLARRFATPEKRMTFPTVLDLQGKELNKEEVYSSQLEILTEVFGGAISGDPAAGLKKTVLYNTTKDAGLMNSFIASNPEMAMKQFKAEDREFALAVKLSGKFKTAFPEGKPKDAPAPDEKKDSNKAPESNEPFVKESEKESVVIIIADSDLLFDEICVKVTNAFGQTILTPLNDNLTFFQNLVEYLSGDSDLIGIRSRKVISRPFTVVQKIQSQAEQQYKNKITELEEDLQKTQERLARLQEEKSKNQKFILSPEQKEEIKNFRQKEANAKKELKKFRKELRLDIDSLENRIKWMNIALVPVLVIIFGIFLALYKNRRNFSK